MTDWQNFGGGLGLGASAKLLLKARGIHLAVGAVFGILAYLISGLTLHSGLLGYLIWDFVALLFASPVLLRISRILAAIHIALTAGWCFAFYKLVLLPIARSALGT